MASTDFRVLVQAQPLLQGRLIDFLESLPKGRCGVWVVSGWQGVVVDATCVTRFDALLGEWSKAPSSAELKAAAQAGAEAAEGKELNGNLDGVWRPVRRNDPLVPSWLGSDGGGAPPGGPPEDPPGESGPTGRPERYAAAPGCAAGAAAAADPAGRRSTSVLRSSREFHALRALGWQRSRQSRARDFSVRLFFRRRIPPGRATHGYIARGRRAVGQLLERRSGAWRAGGPAHTQPRSPGRPARYPKFWLGSPTMCAPAPVPWTRGSRARPMSKRLSS
jgi:hypothetical protein